MISRARKLNEGAIIVAAGCYAQLAAEKLRQIAGVNIVVGADKRRDIVTLVESARQDRQNSVAVKKYAELTDFEDIPMTLMPKRTRGFLKIEDGCENFCSYCIIPYARGKVRSRSLAAIARETAKYTAAGFREIVLTGIHLGAYGRDFAEKTTLADACRRVLQDDKLKRLRLSSLESIELDEEIIELMKSDLRFCRHLHLPLQSGSDAVLKNMNRHYTTADFDALLAKIRRELPGVNITTDIIVGFPGETEELFGQTLKFMQSCKFGRVHVFPYSPREGTPAAKMKNQVPKETKKERVRLLQEAAKKSAEEFSQSFVGQDMPVLFETEKDNVTDGLTDNYIRVYARGKIKSGEIRMVHIEKLHRDGVWGRVTK